MARRALRSGRLWVFVATIGVALPTALVLAPAALHYDDIRRLAHQPPPSTAFMDARTNGSRPNGGLVHSWIDYERISPALARAVVVAEDARFVDHDGIDWDAVSRAFQRNWSDAGIVRGGSTITQQLAKNLYLSERRSYLRKAQEAALALLLDQSLGKRRILELYLNYIEWGDGVFGAEAAARHYYGVSAAHLAAHQAARLAARIPRPRYYDRVGATNYLRERSAQIKGWMPNARVP
ncbi:MAG: monofunctional biosynthetic peptidoglycan transglycosylase [Halofilum sp. (in: g-proteobacteria)]